MSTFKSTFDVLTVAAIKKWYSNVGSHYGALLHLGERAINSQIERYSLDAYFIGAAGVYTDRKSWGSLVLMDAPATLTRAYITLSYVDEATVMGANCHASVFYTTDNFVTRTVLCADTAISTTSPVTALPLTATSIPDNALVVAALQAPNGSDFAGAIHIELVRTGISG